MDQQQTETSPRRRAVPYVRVADSGGNTDSLDHQIAQVVQFAQAKGWHLDGVAVDDSRWPDYADIGVSGTLPAVERPGFSRLLEDARAGAFDCLVALDLSRLGRGIVPAAEAIQALSALGVGVVLVREGVDTSTPMASFLFNVMLNIAQAERRATETDD